MAIVLVYFAIVIGLTIWAENWKGRGVGTLLCSLLLSPLVGFIYMMASSEKHLMVEFVCNKCGYKLMGKKGSNPDCPRCETFPGRGIKIHKGNCKCNCK